MNRFVIGITAVLFSLILLFSAPQIQAQELRFATCDVCGYCPDSFPTPPGNWEACRACIYPNAATDPAQKATLVVDDTSNIPPTPMPGTQYTIFGCVKTNLTDFTQTGAASSLVQILLDVIFMTAGGVAILYLIYGSFLVMTSQADPERLAYGKRVILGAIIGVVFAFSSVFIVNMLANGILKIPGFDGGTSQTPP